MTETSTRNMSRSTLIRHLRAGLTDVKESMTLRRPRFDDQTEGWKVSWTERAGMHPFVEWTNGNMNRNRTTEERKVLRDAALDEIETLLKSRGYVTKRETNFIYVLRRMGES